MYFKVLICSTLVCLAVADFKYLSRMYVPPSPHSTQREEAQRVTHASKDEVVEKKLNSNSSQSATQKAYQDMIYGNVPFGYNGLSGGLPAAFPHYHQGLGGQTPPLCLTPQAFVPPCIPPTQGLTSPVYPQQVFSGQFYPGQTHGFPAQGLPGLTFPGQNFFRPGLSGPFLPNYPIYFSPSEELSAEEKETNADDQLQARLAVRGTQYDSINGGYWYKKPSTAF